MMSERNEQHGTLHRAVDKASDAVGGMVGRAAANSAGSTSGASFVENAAIGDMYEIAAAKVALQHAQSDLVKAAAHKMIADHTTSTHQLRSAMMMNETKGVPALPDSIDARRKTMLDHLQAAPADKFDATYLDQQVLAHKETVDLMNGFKDGGDNAQLRSFAAGTAPVVERHLAAMERLRDQIA
jgi:putative membrane protein